MIAILGAITMVLLLFRKPLISFGFIFMGNNFLKQNCTYKIIMWPKPLSSHWAYPLNPALILPKASCINWTWSKLAADFAIVTHLPWFYAQCLMCSCHNKSNPLLLFVGRNLLMFPESTPIPSRATLNSVVKMHLIAVSMNKNNWSQSLEPGWVQAAKL